MGGGGGGGGNAMVGKASHTCKHTRVAAVIVVWRVRTTGMKLTRMMDVGGGGGGHGQRHRQICIVIDLRSLTFQTTGGRTEAGTELCTSSNQASGGRHHSCSRGRSKAAE